MNKAIAKLVFIAFWGMFFQCQAMTAVATAQTATFPVGAHAPAKKGFCKKKLINDQQRVSFVKIGQSNKKQPGHSIDPATIGRFVAHFIAALLPATSVVGVYAHPSDHWSAALYRANPNKAPPRSFLV